MLKNILAALVCASAFLVSGCGGGGGGGGGGPSLEPVSVSASQQSISVSGMLAGGFPVASVSVTVDHIPSSGLYVTGSYTTRGIDYVSAYGANTTEYVNLTFKTPSTLGVGVYTDTLTIQVCRDQQCTQQVSNSPVQITVTYTVTATAASTLTSLLPSAAARGGSEFVMEVSGTNVNSNSQVYWNGSPRQTTLVSATRLWAQIPASDIATTGNYPVTVVNSVYPTAPTNPITVPVTNPGLSLTMLSPASITVGNPAFALTVVGTGFDASSVVRWNGSARATTYVSTTELLAQINSSDVASQGMASITVAGPGAVVSTPVLANVAAPSVDAAGFQSNAQHNGVMNFSTVVAPSAFPLSSKWSVTLNGPTSNVLTSYGRVFAMASLPSGGSELSAFSMISGARLWGPVAFPTEAHAVYDNGELFVLSVEAGGAGRLSGYDLSNGVESWNVVLTAEPSFAGSVPTAANGMIYVVGHGNGGTLFAVNQRGGALVWSRPVNGGFYGTPAVTADGVYVNYDCKTKAFRPQTGALLWSDNSSCAGGSGDGLTVVAANGLVYSHNQPTGYSGTAFAAKTGVSNSSYTTYGTLPVVGAQVAYFLQSNNALQAVRLSDGATLWTSSGDGYLMSAPLLVNNYVFALSDLSNLMAWDATTGNLLWQDGPTSGPSTSPVAMAGGSKLYAGGGLLLVPRGNTLTAYTLSNNP